jgi:hypothetical protein
MPPVRLEPTISVLERAKTVRALDRAATVIGNNRVLRRTFGPKIDEVTGERRKLYNEELHDLYSSSSIIRIMKSRMRRARYVA